MTIDLRSDTVTVPDEGMLKAMMMAPVGDDVFGEDPTVNELQEKIADFFGFEAALFVPSGTMANQIAIRLHTMPGDEILCDENSHIFHYETGGAAWNAGAQIKPLKGNNGILSIDAMEEAILPSMDWFPRTRLVCLENTCNRAGGTFYLPSQTQHIFELCQKHSLKLHIDGARIWNALAETNQNPKELGKYCHTMSVCLSKGLGCPAGSVLLGCRSDIEHARRIRKVMGGGMRQAGYLAAAGLFALKHNLENFKKDHQKTKKIYHILKNQPWVDQINEPQTNILLFSVKNPPGHDAILEFFKENSILVSMISKTQIRIVVHFQISENHVKHIESVCKNLQSLY